MGSEIEAAVSTSTIEEQGSEEIVVQVPGSADVRGPARQALMGAVGQYAVDVLAEASRREVAARGSSSKEIQYTSAHFEDARSYVRTSGYVPRASWWYVPTRILVPICFCAAGVAVPLALPKDAWIGWGFVSGGSLMAAVFLSVVLEVVQNRKRV